MVPVVVPSITTETPGSGAPSSELVTVPEIVTVCAAIKPVPAKSTKSVSKYFPNHFFLRFIELSLHN